MSWASIGFARVDFVDLSPLCVSALVSIERVLQEHPMDDLAREEDRRVYALERSPLRPCVYCGKAPSTEKPHPLCAGCRHAAYCVRERRRRIAEYDQNRDCQRADRPAHRILCVYNNQPLQRHAADGTGQKLAAACANFVNVNSSLLVRTGLLAGLANGLITDPESLARLWLRVDATFAYDGRGWIISSAEIAPASTFLPAMEARDVAKGEPPHLVEANARSNIESTADSIRLASQGYLSIPVALIFENEHGGKYGSFGPYTLAFSDPHAGTASVMVDFRQRVVRGEYDATNWLQYLLEFADLHVDDSSQEPAYPSEG